MKKRLVVGLSGASGAILCVSLLEAMRKEKDWEVHLVASEAGERVLREETGMNGNDLARLAFRTHDIGNIGAAIASGTFETEGMAVVPCSMKTLAGICHGYAENLLLRAADVTLKERRKLVLVARETPASGGGKDHDRRRDTDPAGARQGNRPERPAAGRRLPRQRDRRRRPAHRRGGIVR